MTTTELYQVNPLSPEELRLMNAYWRAANYLSVGQIYLYDNPLLREPLKLEHVKPRLLGHWGHDPRTQLHLRASQSTYQPARIKCHLYYRAGHGGPGLVANTYLEGTYSEIYPHISQDEAGMKRLFKQFSFPGGIPSHVAPKLPAPFMKEANSVIQSHMRMARFSIILIYWPAVSSVTVRLRLDR